MSNRGPLSPETRKQILKMHRDGYTQLMIADRVGVHRHSVANVIARSAVATPAELREQIAQLKAELAARDVEVAELRRLGAALGQGPRLVAGALEPPAPSSSAARRAKSQATPPRPAPAEVASAGLAPITTWWRLEQERQRCGYPLPDGPNRGWSEVQARAWLARMNGEAPGLPGSFCP
jgi:hypothetical protein